MLAPHPPTLRQHRAQLERDLQAEYPTVEAESIAYQADASAQPTWQAAIRRYIDAGGEFRPAWLNTLDAADVDGIIQYAGIRHKPIPARWRGLAKRAR